MLKRWFGRRDAPDIDPLQRAQSLLDAGRMLEAVVVLRDLVARQPQHAAYRVQLAYALQEVSDDAGALAELREAVQLDRCLFDARYMLGEALAARDDHTGAAEQLRAAVSLRPDFEPARGALLHALVGSGALDEALKLAQAARAADAARPEPLLYIGNIRLAQKRPLEAVDAFRALLVLDPGHAVAHGNLGVALMHAGQLDEAVESLQHALQLRPGQADVLINLAAAHCGQQRFEDAEAVLRRLVEAEPEHAEGWNQLGGVLKEQARMPEAVAAFERALVLRPSMPGSYANLALALCEMNQFAQAEAVARKGLEAAPAAVLHNTLGIALQRRGLPIEAIAEHRRAIELDPGNLTFRCNLAGAYSETEEPQRAIDEYRSILEADPAYLVVQSNLLFLLCYDQRASPAEYLKAAQRFGASLERAALPPLAPDAAAGQARPLRVGFVSGDLGEHPVGRFVEGLLHEIDTQRFELHAYATAATGDALTKRIRPRFAAWHVLPKERPERAAEAIRADGIDVLIDLAGHSALNGLPVFAQRAAPLQLSWLGYFASTGLPEMDYVLADPVCVPPGSEWQFSERVWRLPHTRLCYTDPGSYAPEVQPLPALTAGTLTFGCLQRQRKFNDRVFACWARILRERPGSRLVLQFQQSDHASTTDALRARLASHGIEPQRVHFLPPARHAAYLASYHQIDVLLDTFPFTGGTTTCEALWMGVPTVTLAGDTMLSRQGAMFLQAAGLPEWVAGSEDDYVARALAHTDNLPRLAALRAGLREAVRLTPAFDSRRFARDFEAALLGMWTETRSRPG